MEPSQVERSLWRLLLPLRFSCVRVFPACCYCHCCCLKLTRALLHYQHANTNKGARTSVIEGWTKTFADVVARMQTLAADGKGCHILNPIVGK